MLSFNFKIKIYETKNHVAIFLLLSIPGTARIKFEQKEIKKNIGKLKKFLFILLLILIFLIEYL